MPNEKYSFVFTIDEVKEFLKQNTNHKKGMVPPLGGATDSAAFAQAGMRATGVTALSHALPDFYHTRLDTPDALNKDCLEKCFAASVKVLEMFDNGAKQ